MSTTPFIHDVPAAQALAAWREACAAAGCPPRVEAVRIGLHEAVGRVTAEPVWATRSSPSFDASAMDGIAVRAAETVGASESTPVALEPGDYVVVAGVVGQRPAYVNGEGVPFMRSIDLAGLPVQVRMESWLAADTIRRMGFGHVVAGRHHALIVERGVSFVALDQTGAPQRTGYASSIFAPQPRYLCYR